MIKDSGHREEYSTGAVRDRKKGVGRCDLLPIGSIAIGLKSSVLVHLNTYKVTGEMSELWECVELFCKERGWDIYTAMIEVSKHFEAGCEKYGENNWQKGIPVKSYIDSGVRHYLKWKRGDDDEPHDRAFIWNMVCGMWTHEHKPEMRLSKENKTEKRCATCKHKKHTFISDDDRLDSPGVIYLGCGLDREVVIADGECKAWEPIDG